MSPGASARQVMRERHQAAAVQASRDPGFRQQVVDAYLARLQARVEQAVNGKPLTAEQLEQLRRDGKIR